MLFILGLITGIVLAGVVFIVLAFFRAGIEKRIKIIETVMAQHGPKPQGYIIEPEDEADEIRREKILENSRAGRPTKLADLE